MDSSDDDDAAQHHAACVFMSPAELAKGVNSPDPNVRLQTFAKVLRDMGEGKSDPQLSDPALARTVWDKIVKAADAAYVPGKLSGQAIARSVLMASCRRWATVSI